jgi:hypothetical protein
LAAGKYKPTELIDWCLKLARVAEGYISFEHPRVSPIEREDRNDYNAEVRADLSRLNVEQLTALKQLALIASGGSTTTISGSSNQPVRQADQRKVGQEEQAKIAPDFERLARAHDRLAHGGGWGDQPKGPQPSPQRPVHAISGAAPPEQPADL